VRNAKDTAHTKAERSILEGVKVLMPLTLSVCVKYCLSLLAVLELPVLIS